MPRAGRRHAQPHPTLSALAEQHAHQLLEQLRDAGLPADLATYTAFAPLLTAALTRLVAEHERDAQQLQQARRDAWVKEQGHLSWQEAQERLELTAKQLRAAIDLDIVTTVKVPTEITGYAFASDYVYAVHELNNTERGRINQQTLLTRLQAAAWLQISPAEFDRRRKAQHITYAETSRGESGWPVYHYRLSDVELLRER
jgi:hypothetical protein